MRILFIEDDAGLNSSISFQLKKEGFEVDACQNGDDGLWYAMQNIYDLILLDRMLPGTNGITILSELRKNQIQTPVILLTALGEVANRVEGLDAGADDYLVKPFDFSELLARIRSISRRPRNLSEKPQLLKLDNLSYDTQKRILKNNSKSCDLSRREGHLIELFLSNPNQTLTRNSLLSRVWGLSADVEDGNLDNYIHFIRRRLKSVDSPYILETVRGVGYRFTSGKS